MNFSWQIEKFIWFSIIIACAALTCILHLQLLNYCIVKLHHMLRIIVLVLLIKYLSIVTTNSANEVCLIFWILCQKFFEESIAHLTRTSWCLHSIWRWRQYLKLNNWLHCVSSSFRNSIVLIFFNMLVYILLKLVYKVFYIKYSLSFWLFYRLNLII